jgi:rubrerythrin
MTQLSLFRPVAQAKTVPGALCEWSTKIEDRDEEHQSLFYHITVQCWEALVTRKIEGKKKTLPGYAVEVFSSLRTGPESPEEELTHYYKDFLQTEKRDAIREYSWCVARVHHQWRTTATSRVNILKETGHTGDYYECPFCGYMGLEFFETCPGCGKRFMGLNN